MYSGVLQIPFEIYYLIAKFIIFKEDLTCYYFEIAINTLKQKFFVVEANFINEESFIRFKIQMKRKI